MANIGQRFQPQTASIPKHRETFYPKKTKSSVAPVPGKSPPIPRGEALRNLSRLNELPPECRAWTGAMGYITLTASLCNGGFAVVVPAMPVVSRGFRPAGREPALSGLQAANPAAVSHRSHGVKLELLVVRVGEVIDG